MSASRGESNIFSFFTLNDDLSTLEHTYAVAAESKEYIRLTRLKLFKRNSCMMSVTVIPISKMLETSEQLCIERNEGMIEVSTKSCLR